MARPLEYLFFPGPQIETDLVFSSEVDRFAFPGKENQGLGYIRRKIQFFVAD